MLQPERDHALAEVVIIDVTQLLHLRMNRRDLRKESTAGIYKVIDSRDLLQESTAGILICVYVCFALTCSSHASADGARDSCGKEVILKG